MPPASQAVGRRDGERPPITGEVGGAVARAITIIHVRAGVTAYR